MFRNKVLSIVFWDLGGFSKLCELLENEPYLIVGFFREFFNEADRIIHKNKGILDKFMGDGLMAIFGFKDNKIYDNKESVLDALKSAIELSAIFEKIKDEWIEIWNNQFGLDIANIYLNCGINTGESLVGNINTEIRDQVTVIGSAVNLAKRIEEVAQKKNQIVVSEETKKKMENKFNLKKININSDHKIRGFEHIKEYYELLKK